MNRYPRDMCRSNTSKTPITWPNGAKIVVQIVLNYEEGGENNIIHGDAASEAFLSEITAAQPWPGQRHWNMESIYEYGARAGFWRLYEGLKSIPITVFGVASALARAPEQVAAMQAAPWEIASHGLKWVEHKDMEPEEELAQIKEAIRLHTEITGIAPKGWYTGRCSMNTVELASSAADFSYIADSYADDLPYWTNTAKGKQLIVPYTLDCNDMRFAIPAGYSEGRQFETYIKDSFDVLYEEGQAGAPKMLSIGLHCRLAGRPGRYAGLKRAIDYMAGHEGVWFATRQEIAEYWAEAYPPKHHQRPCEMDEEEFTATFGSIYEHSPWIAQRAHKLELSPMHDTAEGMHFALARAFRSASEEERMNVVCAHPDLAGKLAAEEKLTQESTSEQSSAGLNALTDDEREQFLALNTAYREKFGFPFIVAVRDHNKEAILKMFETRLQNSKTEEFFQACKQVERIAQCRLQDKLS